MRQWKESIESPIFVDMETYSNDFLKMNSDIAEEYSKKWPMDPLHTWSRVWEYPYVATHIERYLVRGDENVVVLDAGSGVTFFPYYLCQRYSIKQLFCIDSDKSFVSLHYRLAKRSKANIRFVPSELAHIDVPDKSVNILYCISVLEHLPDWNLAIKEFSRVLRPGGIMILTIDLSLDNRYAIIPVEAGRLLACVVENFPIATVPSGDEIQSAVAGRDVLTMPSIWPKHDRLIPKRIPRPTVGTALKSLLHLRLPRNPIPNLAVYGGVFVK
jgi:ubiquinone/menaquinone biosynthesis C-methylase UbiE